VAWPLAARAQQPTKLQTIGFLYQSTPSAESSRAAAFVQQLRKLGWIEGNTIAIEYREAAGRPERMAEIATEFVRLKVDVIVTSGTAAVMALKKATTAIPIVFGAAGDPVGTGLVASLAQPGGNVTGMSIVSTDLIGKRLDLLRLVVPGLRRLAVMANVDNVLTMLEMGEVRAKGPSAGLDEVVTVEIRRADDIAPAIERLKGNADALYVCPDGLVNSNRVRLNALALAARLPTMHSLREYLEAVGLMSYGPNIPDLFRRAAELVDKILRGTKPANIPVEEPTKFDLAINLTTAKALGLEVPHNLLVLADELIE